MVSCHSDLKPENLVFDGQRVWLVGWQAALLNDRYFDLAVAANFVVTSDADEWTYLEEYFGQEARFDEALGIVSERNTSEEGVRLLLPSAP